ncbi:MAG: YdeI/OmpD-associated family protein [Fimbriimonadales bacterium]|nr:YdeI/OmpD-associated family protein [Fimbriimonadales bacterium]
MRRAARWQGEIRVFGGSAGVGLPFDPRSQWGERGRYDLCGTVGGHPWRGPLRRAGDGWILPTGPAFLRDAGLSVGRTVPVEVGLEPPTLEDLDEDLRSAIESDPEALRAFHALHSFGRKNLVRHVTEAKRPETRARRIREAIASLKSGG